MRKNREKPCLLCRIAAWGCALLMTVTLSAALLGYGTVRAVTSEELHISAATNDRIITDQIARVSRRVEELAEDYSFSAGDVLAGITREDFEALNRETAVWWTRIVNEGRIETIPAWSAGPIRPVIEATLDDEKIPAGRTRFEVASEVSSILEKSVQDTMMPVRKALITLGVRYLKRRIDLPGAVRMASQAPGFGAAVSLILAGMIALLLAKDIRRSLKYYGAAFAGAGISAAAGGILIRMLDIPGMVRQATDGFADQLDMTMGTVMLESGIAAAVLLAAGFACLILYTRAPGKKTAAGGLNPDG